MCQGPITGARRINLWRIRSAANLVVNKLHSERIRRHPFIKLRSLIRKAGIPPSPTPAKTERTEGRDRGDTFEDL